MGMKRKSSGRGHGGGAGKKIKKLQLSVQQFVEKAEGGGSGDPIVDPPGPARFQAARGRQKSRKELRREKRLNKKSSRKAFYERKFLGKGPNEKGQKKPPTPEAAEKGQKKLATPEAAEKGQKKLATPEASEKGQKKPPTPKASEKGQKKPPTPEAAEKGQKKPATPEAPGQQSGGRGKEVKKQVSKKKKKKLNREEARKKNLLEDNEKEEKEIKRLEKSLRMNKRKNKTSLPQAFTQDGLDYILGLLEPGGSAFGVYDDEEEEVNTTDKLQKLSEHVDDGDEKTRGTDDDDGGSEMDDESEGGEDMEEDDVVGELSEEDEALETILEDSGEEDTTQEEEDQSGGTSQDSDGEDVDEPGTVAQTSPSPANKYVPPHLRPSSDAADAKRRQELERLRKSVKGLMNRLSEPNMASISGQLEELYMANSRKDMNDTLSHVVLSACITPALMPDRLMMEHVLLTSVLHHTVGIEVGAHILETVVKQFHDQREHVTDSKECDNLLTFIGHLYNFHVVDSRLMFDLLKTLVSTFTERNIELILLLLKNVGFSLRKDDALALKELICEAQNKAGAADKKFQDQSRVRFMLEIMLALKNNDMRKIPGYDPEPVEKLRKLQRSLVHGSVSGSDTRLRVSLENILEADKVGRWWIVGSSWSGAPMIGQSSAKTSAQAVGKVSAKILELARKQRMNTDIRRNIFCVIMTSEDYLDAFENLLKLGLKDQQEREIVHVLIDCCLQEKSYNPFYSLLSCKFCQFDRRFQMTFQFSMWDKFRDLDSLSATAFSNLVNFLTHLVKSKSLPISVFKVIEFSELDKVKVSFLRQVLYKLLADSEADELAAVFGRIADNPKLAMLREGLKLFISHFLLKNIRAQKTAEEAELLTQRADLAVKALQAKDSKLRL